MINSLFSISGNATPLFLDAKTSIARKILVFSSEEDFYDLNEQYESSISAGLSSIPYHYVITNGSLERGDGEILYVRPTAFAAELSLNRFNFVNHCISILLVGPAADRTQAQIDSLRTLCLFLLSGIGINLEDVVDASAIKTGLSSMPSWQAFIADLFSHVALADAYKAVPLPSENFVKIISGKAFHSFPEIALLTGVPEDFLRRMNLHVTTDEIPIGTTLFAPTNKLSLSAKGMFFRDFSKFAAGRN